jgi:hypothetical protein
MLAPGLATFTREEALRLVETRERLDKLVAGVQRVLDQTDGPDRGALSTSVSPRGPATAVSFWAFDLLWLDGDLLIDRPYAERRAELEALPFGGSAGSSLVSPVRMRMTSWPPPPRTSVSCSSDSPLGIGPGSAAAIGAR